ncbi:MAG: GTP pyrophosphokinase family protein [Clostridiales bacterium]|nr:GTP pyrophosphokinase family protein [Clostridiales bacterium]
MSNPLENDRQLPALPEDFQRMVDDFFTVQCRYQAAIREIRTKLENLDDEFQMKHKRNPVHHMQSRMKSVQSMMEKLSRRNKTQNINSAVENLTDIAGIRVICSYVQDVYTVAELLTCQDDIHLLRVRDYIKHPKENGYRSLHLVVEIPVFLYEGRVMVPVEIQIRTIAMDFWASLEHSLRYKASGNVPDEISEKLKQTAEDIAVLDQRMQYIHDQVDALIPDE